MHPLCIPCVLTCHLCYLSFCFSTCCIGFLFICLFLLIKQIFLACKFLKFCFPCRALLYGGMRESQPEAEIPLQDTTAEAFTMLMKYIYTGRATLRDEKEEVLLDFLSLAHKYGFPELEDSTSEYLCTILNIQNVCMTFDVASLYSLPKLTCMCCMFMDRNAQEVLSSEGFLSLSKVQFLFSFFLGIINFYLHTFHDKILML